MQHFQRTKIEEITQTCFNDSIFAAFLLFSDFTEQEQRKELSKQLRENGLDYTRFLQLCNGRYCYHPFPNSCLQLNHQHLLNASRMVLPNIAHQYVAMAYPPLDDLENFWNSMLLEKSRLILSLSNLTPFTPTLEDRVKVHGSLVVELIEEKRSIYLTKRTLAVFQNNSTTRLPHHIVQLLFNGWEDGSIPKKDAFQEYCRKIQEEEECSSQASFVHCYAGIGRTGTLILYLFMKKLLQKNKKISERELYKKIFETLFYLRMQRFGQVVQTVQQLLFCIEMLHDTKDICC